MQAIESSGVLPMLQTKIYRMKINIELIGRFLFGSLLVLAATLSAAAQETDYIQEAIEKLQSPDPEIRLKAVGALNVRRNQERVIEPLIRMLNDPDERVRSSAIRNLGGFKDKRAAKPVLARLGKEKGLLKMETIRALGEISDESAFEPLVKLLESQTTSENLSYQAEAGDALAKFKDVRAFAPLFRKVRTEMGTYAERAIIAMGSPAVEPLCRLVEKDDYNDRFYAMKILETIADESAVPTLISVLGIEVSGVGAMASNALAWRVGAPAIDELLKAAADGNPEKRRNAINALGQIKNERVVPALFAGLKDDNLRVRRTALEKIVKYTGADISHLLITAFDDPELKYEAAVALGEKRDVRALPILIEGLKGTNTDISIRTLTALIGIGEPAVDDLISVLLDKNEEYPERETTSECRRQGMLVKPNTFVISCVNEPQPPTIRDPRRLAAIALGSIGDRRAVEPLRQTLSDKNAKLREDSANALKKLEVQP